MLIAIVQQQPGDYIGVTRNAEERHYPRCTRSGLINAGGITLSGGHRLI